MSVMPFGKHKGKPLNQIPKDYLSWVLQECNIKDWLYKEIEDILGLTKDDWNDGYDAGFKEGQKQSLPSNQTQVVSEFRKRMAVLFHPDRYPDPKVMVEVNSFCDALIGKNKRH